MGVIKYFLSMLSFFIFIGCNGGGTSEYPKVKLEAILAELGDSSLVYKGFDEYKLEGVKLLSKDVLEYPFLFLVNSANKIVLKLFPNDNLRHSCEVILLKKEGYYQRHIVEKELNKFIHTYYIYCNEQVIEYTYLSNSSSNIENAELTHLEIENANSGLAYTFGKVYFIEPKCLPLDFAPPSDMIAVKKEIIKSWEEKALIVQELTKSFDEEVGLRESKFKYGYDLKDYPYIFRNCSYCNLKMLLGNR